MGLDDVCACALADVTVEQLKLLNPEINLSKIAEGNTILLPSGRLSSRDKVHAGEDVRAAQQQQYACLQSCVVLATDGEHQLMSPCFTVQSGCSSTTSSC
jgi:hypothetical protein